MNICGVFAIAILTALSNFVITNLNLKQYPEAQTFVGHGRFVFIKVTILSQLPDKIIKT